MKRKKIFGGVLLVCVVGFAFCGVAFLAKILVGPAEPLPRIGESRIEFIDPKPEANRPKADAYIFVGEPSDEEKAQIIARLIKNICVKNGKIVGGFPNGHSITIGQKFAHQPGPQKTEKETK